MNMRLDQSATSQPSTGIVSLCLRRQALFDGGNLPVRNANIHWTCCEIRCQPDVANDQIHSQNTLLFEKARRSREVPSLRPAGLTRGEAILTPSCTADRDCFVAPLLAM